MDQYYKTICNEETRDLLLRVCDGVAALTPLLWYINQLTRPEEACRWLIRNNLTGQNLFGLWAIEYDRSFLKVLARIIQGLEQEQKMRPIFVGRDLSRS